MHIFSHFDSLEMSRHHGSIFPLMFPKRAAHPTVDGVLLGLVGHIILISGTVMLSCSFTNSNGLVKIYIPLTRQIQPFMLNILPVSPHPVFILDI